MDLPQPETPISTTVVDRSGRRSGCARAGLLIGQVDNPTLEGGARPRTRNQLRTLHPTCWPTRWPWSPVPDPASDVPSRSPTGRPAPGWSSTFIRKRDVTRPRRLPNRRDEERGRSVPTWATRPPSRSSSPRSTSATVAWTCWSTTPASRASRRPSMRIRLHVRPDHRHEPARHVPVHARGVSTHARGWPRADHQRQLGARGPGLPRQQRLRGLEGRRPDADATAALELAPHGITVVNLAPGAVATPINRATLDDDRLRQALLAEIPLGRIADPTRSPARPSSWRATPRAT